MENFELYIIIAQENDILQEPEVTTDHAVALRAMSDIVVPQGFRMPYFNEDPREYDEAYHEWIGEHHQEDPMHFFVKELNIGVSFTTQIN